MKNKPREKSSPRMIRAVERQTLALKLRMSGASLQEICDAEIGYSSRGAVSNAIQAALKREICETVNEYRTLAQLRLERLLRANWPIALNPGHPKFLAASENCRRLIKDLRDLFGLDAPIRFQDETPTDETVKAEIAALNAKLDEMPAAERQLLARSLFDLEGRGFSDN